MASVNDFKKDKIAAAMVTTLMPETHYSRYLLEALNSECYDSLAILAYANKEDKIRELRGTVKVKQVWSQNLLYPFQIMRQTVKDRVMIVHLQHEINMFGGPLTVVLFPLLLMLLKLSRKKVIVTVHGVVPRREIDLDFLKTFSWPERKLLITIAKIILSYIYVTTAWFSDAIIIHSPYLKSIMISDYRAKAEKIQVIPIGIPAPENSSSEDLSASWWQSIKDKKIILFFGYLLRRKGLEYLIEAFEHIGKKHLDYVLVLAGGTLKGHEDYVELLEKIAERKNITKQVIFTSFLSKKEIDKLYRATEFVVLPYTYSISASLPLSLATSYHKPVIATNIGTFRDEISDGEEGLLCPPKDAVLLEKAMLKLIEAPTLLREMSGNVGRRAAERTWAKIAEQTRELYRKLTGDRILLNEK